uniref:Uncharacterized protein n=1 Tax=Candidatus Kentrum sp. DK TaxID=2126562 RepID=A0A450TDK1_9GAMM|nr:MAG: hypothetical protein BECKDK2373B_GA0170837_11436 [Candidatus Kentron sp. DK]
MMRAYYNGYRFSRRAGEHVYNPTLALYFLKEFQAECRYPDEILDSNLAMDRGKMHYIAQLPGGPRLIFDTLAEDEESPVRVRRLSDRFGVEDMRYAPKDTDFVASLLYYFGILTFGGMTPLRGTNSDYSQSGHPQALRREHPGAVAARGRGSR